MIAPTERNLFPNLTFFKMDQLFYQGIIKNRQVSLLRIGYSILKSLVFIIFLPIDVALLKTKNTDIIVYMAISIAFCISVVLLSVAIYWKCFRDSINNNLVFLQLAASTEHIVREEPILDPQAIKKLDNCVSVLFYNATNATLI